MRPRTKDAWASQSTDRSNGLVMNYADVRIDVALTLGAQMAVGALKLRLLAALGAQVVTERALPTVYLAARGAGEGTWALPGRGIEQPVLGVVLVLLGVLSRVDKDAGAHVQGDRALVWLGQRQVFDDVTDAIAQVERAPPHQLRQHHHLTVLAGRRAGGARRPWRAGLRPGRARRGRGGHRRRR